MNAIVRFLRPTPQAPADLSGALSLSDFADLNEAQAAYVAAKAARRECQARLATAEAAAREGIDHDADEAFVAFDHSQAATIAALKRSLRSAQGAEARMRAARDEVRSRRMVEVSREVGPVYRAAIRDVARALVALSEANRASEAILDRLTAQGISPDEVGIIRMAFAPATLGERWGCGSGPADIWLEAARRLGIIDADEELADLVAEVR